MTEEEYKAAIEQYKAEHSAGGSLEHGEWKKHKYIRIENGRYIYPEDLKKTASNNVKTLTGGTQAVKNKISETINAFKSAGQNISQAVKEHKAEAESKKAAAEAMKAGRTATQQYKESGQYEKDVAAEKNKKEFEESTKQLSPQEQYKKEQAELTKQNTPENKAKALENDILKYAKKGSSTYDKAMEKVNEILSKNPNAEVEVSLGENRNGIDMRGYLHLYEKSPNKDGSGIGTYIPLNYNPPKQEEADQKKDVGTETPGMSKLRDMSVDAQEKAKKAAEEKVQAKKNEYLELGKKNGLTDSDVDEFIKTAEYNYNWRKDLAMKHATSRAKDYGDDYTVKLEPHEHGSMEDIVIYRPDGSRLGKFVSIENLESDIQNQLSRGKESPYYTKKVQHSYTDPKSFYAAVYDYKQAHKR